VCAMSGGTCSTHTSFSHRPFDTVWLHYQWLHCQVPGAGGGGQVGFLWGERTYVLCCSSCISHQEAP
jgi:hypothetical protein